ncbi:jg178, partial [Pararge aegeria aegeria]
MDQRVAKLKWQWPGHIVRRKDGRWDEGAGMAVSAAVVDPPTRWTDDIKRVA